MISNIHAHCSIKGCRNHVSINVAQDMKRKGKPVVCYEHNISRPERIRELYDPHDCKLASDGWCDCRTLI